MRRIAVMQPTYLPWLGYFDLIDCADVFVFLDSVQFNRRSWQQRNKIKTHKGDDFLSVPVESKGKVHQLISQVIIDYGQKFPRGHLGAIQHAYSGSEHFELLYAKLVEIYESRPRFLAELNIQLIKKMVEGFGLSTKFYRSSDLPVTGKRSNLILSICEYFEMDVYLSPSGSRLYLEEDRVFGDSQVSVVFQEFLHPRHRQLHGSFLTHMSGLDLLMNEGPDSLAILRRLRRLK